MKYKHLVPITSKESTIPREGVIAINTDIPENPILEVYHKGEWEVIDNAGKISRFEDLYTTLYHRDWFIGRRLYTDGKALYVSLKKYNTPVPVISRDLSFVKTDYSTLQGVSEFNELYTKLIMQDIKEIDLGSDYHQHMVSSRNLLDQSSVIDLFDYSENSTDYGSILNLNQLLQETGNKKYLPESITIRLEVMYVKDGVRMSGTLIFEPFKVDASGNLVMERFQSLINGEVTVEVQDGCIRLFPEKREITECIIYHCYLVYGKLV